jgi:hypothetical protein
MVVDREKGVGSGGREISSVNRRTERSDDIFRCPQMPTIRTADLRDVEEPHTIKDQEKKTK